VRVRRRYRTHLRAVLRPLYLCILAALLAPDAHAQNSDKYWDPNGTAVGSGGPGTWGLSGLFWSANNDGVSGPYSVWGNAALDNAIFGGTPTGTVTLGEPITVHNITLGGAIR
jgi:fibronectin-binding autotransporter adhesin